MLLSVHRCTIKYTRVGSDDGLLVTTGHHTVAVTVETDLCIHHKHNYIQHQERTICQPHSACHSLTHTVLLWCPGLGQVNQLLVPTVQTDNNVLPASNDAFNCYVCRADFPPIPSENLLNMHQGAFTLVRKCFFSGLCVTITNTL